MLLVQTSTVQTDSKQVPKTYRAWRKVLHAKQPTPNRKVELKDHKVSNICRVPKDVHQFCGVLLKTLYVLLINSLKTPQLPLVV